MIGATSGAIGRIATANSYVAHAKVGVFVRSNVHRGPLLARIAVNILPGADVRIPPGVTSG